MTDVMLSIIIPIYNNEKFMPDLLKRIEDCPYINIEFILIDDGSSDGGISIAKEKSKQDNRIFIYSKENGGVASARNYGSTKAHGEYMCFVDQDDIINFKIYEKLLKTMIEKECEVGLCSSGKMFENTKVILDLQKNAVYEGKEIVRHQILPVIFNDFDIKDDNLRITHENHIWVCIIKKDFWDKNKIKFRSYVDFEDDLLVKIEILSLAHRVCTIPEIGYYWRMHGSSESSSHKYVENIGIKQDKEYQDIKRSLKNVESECYNENLVKQIIYCKQYIKAIICVTGYGARTDREFIKTYFENNIYNREFDTMIRGAQYLCTNKIRWKLLFPLLRRKKTFLCYYVEKIIDVMQQKGLDKRINIILKRT